MNKDQYKTVPYPHQKECFERFCDRSILALLAEMGTGKSKIAIDIAAHKSRIGQHNRLVVIGPLAVHPQWVDEQLPAHCNVPYKAYSLKPGNLKRDIYAMERFFMDCKVNPNELRVLTINYESFIRVKGHALVKEFAATSELPPMFILDEATRIKNPKAKTTKSILKLRRLYPDSWRAIITGSPAAKSPVDTYSQFDFLKNRYMGMSYQAFEHHHTVQIVKQMKVKGRLISVKSVLDEFTYKQISTTIKKNSNEYGILNPAAVPYICDRFGLSYGDLKTLKESGEMVRFKNLDRLQEKIAPDTFSVRKADCLELPDKIYKEVKFPPNAEQKKLIKQLNKHAVAIHHGELLTVQQKSQLGLRILQICGGFCAVDTDVDGVYDTVPVEGVNAKLNFILEMMDELAGESFIVWASRPAEIEMLEKALSKVYTCDTLYGATDKAARPDIVARFKTGDFQCLIANPAVGGYGLNLQGAAVQIYYSRDYRTEARLQAEDRSHRIGTFRAPVYYDLLYDVPFEKAVLSSLKEGKDLNQQIVSMKLADILAVS